jgi:hypothetical protein
MSVDDEVIVQAPRRLAEGSDVAADGLRALALRARPDARAEARAWVRVSERGAGVASRWLWSGAFVAAGVAAAVWFAGLSGGPAPLATSPQAAREVASSPAVAATSAAQQTAGAGNVKRRGGARHGAVGGVAPSGGASREAAPEAIHGGSVEASRTPVAARDGAPTDEAPPRARVKLSRRPVALAAGRAALAAEATVEVRGGTKARASADRSWVRVTLDRGEVGLHVAKRVAGGPGFEVVAGAYHFRVLGTRFRVARVPAGVAPVELWVEEGRVAVSRRGRVLSVVEAGGHWDPRPEASPALATGPARRRVAARASVAPVVRAQVQDDEATPPSTPMLTRARCAVLADESATAREAVACYLEQARRQGIAAETALFEIARLRRDVLGDTEGALSALRESRARFPRGMLRHEVDLSIVELLPKLNRHGEAIEEIGRMLSEGHGEERAAELHVLRGNIYREVLEDFVRAERDYAVAEDERSPAVGDATFLRGVCLQALGHADLARAAFQRYLASGTHRFTDEAKRRLDRLN